MAPTNKTPEARRKSGGSGKTSLIVDLKVTPSQLRLILEPETTKEETPAQETPDVKLSPESSGQIGQPANGENASDSNDATPQADGTPAPSVMAPPSEGAKKKGTKRAAPKENGASDGLPKQRGKPGPKKKQKIDDGSLDAAAGANRAGGGHKLGPKANQGAINAGLRALDRSGKPCRKWGRGSFKLKSFTGVTWEISRWTAPPKKGPESGTEDSAAPSADNSSSKENKENAEGGNSAVNSNSGADVEMQSAASNHASSPAPMAVAAAS